MFVSEREIVCGWGSTNPRFEPIVEPDNVRVSQPLQQVQLIHHHLFVALDVLLQDDLDRNLALRAVGLADNAICACTERPPHSVP